MKTITSALSEANTKDLLRSYHSQKEYLYFDISVFNIGASVFIKCTNNFKIEHQNNWNGYNFIITNCETTKFYILETLKDFISKAGLATLMS